MEFSKRISKTAFAPQTIDEEQSYRKVKLAASKPRKQQTSI